MIEELLLFETHPNPAGDMVQVQAEFEAPKSIRVVISTLSGQPVFKEEVDAQIYNRQVDLSSVAKGFYKVSIYTEDEVITKRWLYYKIFIYC